MTLSNEDKKDVQNHMGKALANKVSKVTNDSKMRAGNAVVAKKKRKQAVWHDIYQSNPGMTKREALMSAESIRDHNRQHPNDKL